MEDVLDIYQLPYDPKRPVVCFDETRKTLHDTPHGTQPARPADGEKPARLAQEDYGYKRNGSVSLCLWYEPLQGTRGVSVRPQHLGVDIAEILRRLSDEVYPDAEKIILVCDNLGTHQAHFLYDRFSAEEAHRLKQRFEWHYTPEHGSWREHRRMRTLGSLKAMSQPSHCRSRTLQAEVKAGEQQRNSQPHTVNWQFTTQDARIKLKRLYPILNYTT